VVIRDKYLIWRAKQGDREALTRIYEENATSMMTVAISLLGKPEDAKDIVQDVFVKLIESLDTLALRSSLKGFLMTCVANKARDRLRQRRQEQNPGRVQNKRIEQGESDPLHLAIQDEQVNRLHEALARLTVEQRECIMLKVHSGLSFRSMAKMMNVPRGMLQRRYYTGLETLLRLNHEEE